jgi:exodeoxyribonuclease VII large subunit
MAKPLLRSLFDEVERRPLSVTELTQQVRGALETRFSSVWVEGEISNFTAAGSGHWYFTLKDQGAQIRSTCFRGVNCRIRFRPTNGLQVRIRGRLTVYEPRGEYQLSVEAVEPVGAGALKIAFEQLRDRLRAEGLFSEELKRPLPLFPRRVGVLTSPTGAAIRDIFNVLSRRTRTVHILFTPTRVQGEGSSDEIARAIQLFNEHHELALADGRDEDLIDVLIVGRGGGSAEDLWAFNEEVVARAIRASIIPVISAVGHETDFTIADFAADYRAPTPSAAAELVAAREEDLADHLLNLSTDLVRLTRYRILDLRTRVQDAAMSPAFDDVQARLRTATQRTDEASHRLETLAARMLQLARRRADEIIARLSPDRMGSRVAEAREKFGVLCAERNAAMESRLETARRRLAVMAASLDALSPLAVLQRGFALAQDEQGRLLRDAAQVLAGDLVQLRLAKGQLLCRVEDTEVGRKPGSY